MRRIVAFLPLLIIAFSVSCSNVPAAETVTMTTDIIGTSPDTLGDIGDRAFESGNLVVYFYTLNQLRLSFFNDPLTVNPGKCFYGKLGVLRTSTTTPGADMIIEVYVDYDGNGVADKIITANYEKIDPNGSKYYVFSFKDTFTQYQPMSYNNRFGHIVNMVVRNKKNWSVIASYNSALEINTGLPSLVKCWTISIFYEFSPNSRELITFMKPGTKVNRIPVAYKRDNLSARYPGYDYFPSMDGSSYYPERRLEVFKYGFLSGNTYYNIDMQLNNYNIIDNYFGYSYNHLMDYK